MTHGFFATVFYIPLYNGLIFLINAIPGKNAGIAVVLLTIIIRFILYPLSKQSIKTQLQMKRIEPEVKKIKEKYKDTQEQARQLMQLYKEKGISPFSGIILILLQLPILIALYQVFQSGLPNIDSSLLYSFVQAPSFIAMNLIGINLTAKSIILAALATITQFIQLQISLPKQTKAATPEKPSFQTDLANSMNTQMKYVLPLILFPIAYISSVLALYLVTSNVFMILQELFVRRRLMRES